MTFVTLWSLAAAVVVVGLWFHRASRRRRASVLRLLRDGREMSGLDLVAASGGLLRRGSVYVVLARLEDEGLVASRLGWPTRRRPSVVAGVPRRLYRLTARGRTRQDATG